MAQIIMCKVNGGTDSDEPPLLPNSLFLFFAQDFCVLFQSHCKQTQIFTQALVETKTEVST